ncbi:MAG: lipoyl(octanoyl) transferase LipB [Pseudomonadota bacterium]|jgi:lipoyl(octanoyl) transferase|nr:MAG: octanoyltransferase [Pseudomonadota bacterium]
MIVRWLGRADYAATWQEMRRFTDGRTADTEDELWLLEHPPVFTLGMAADPGHVLDAGDIPVVQTDRGGQVTYHGPGQLVAYPLLDLRRHGLTVRGLVTLLEQSVIDLVAEQGIAAMARRDAPGVYVEGRKLAALGLRVRRGASYHGLALNVELDVSPFARINPCGMRGLPVTSLAELGVHWTVEEAGWRLADRLRGRLVQAAAGRVEAEAGAAP